MASAPLADEVQVQAWLDSLPQDFKNSINGSLNHAQSRNSYEDLVYAINHLLDQIVGVIKIDYDSPVPQCLCNALFDSGDRQGIVLIRTPETKANWAAIFKEMSFASFLLRSHEKEILKLSQVETNRNFLHQAFRVTYAGSAHTDLADGVEIYSDLYASSDKYFGRIIPILQSSGTGKSRMVEEFGDLQPTLSICFRKDDSPHTGWPPRDAAACSFFFKSRDTRFKGEELAAAFIGALISQIAAEVQQRQHDEILHVPKGFKTLWPHDLSDARRPEFFEAVEKKADSVLQDVEGRILEYRRQYFVSKDSTSASAHQVGHKSPTHASRPVPKSLAYWHNELYALMCEEHFKKLAELLHALEYTRFFVAFDECTALGIASVSEPEDRMTLLALRRILLHTDTQFSGVQFWYFMLDTISSYSALAPSGPLAASARLRGVMRILPTWIYVGFNQLVRDGGEVTKLSTARSALRLDNLVQYGRPYWNTLGDDVVVPARRKLFNADYFNATDVDQVFAAFSHRVPLELGTGQASQRIAANAVSRHMRILTGVHLGDILVTEAPPEPILSIAAADALNSSPSIFPVAFKTLVNEIILKGAVIEQGQHGELISTLFWTAARDDACVLQTMENPSNSIVRNKCRGDQSVRAVSLSAVLSSLIHSGADLRRLHDFAADKWTNYTFCIRLDAIYDAIPLSLLVLGWRIGAMFRCHPLQPVIDGFVVVYHGNLDQPFDPTALEYVAWRSKLRADASDNVLFDELTGPFIESSIIVNGDSVTKRWKPEHLVILMDFGAAARFRRSLVGVGGKVEMQTVAKQIRLEYRAADRPDFSKADQCPRRKFYAENPDDEPSRYALWLRGQTSDMYPFLKEVKREFDTLLEWNEIICNTDFMDHDKRLKDGMDIVSWWQGVNPDRELSELSKGKKRNIENVEDIEKKAEKKASGSKE